MKLIEDKNMINAQNLIYSRAAAARILQVDYLNIENLEIWNKVILVKIKEQRPTFISKKVFKQHFAEWRKSRAKALKVTPNLFSDNLFTVHNPYKDTRYQVSLHPEELICNCEDWSNQKEYLGRACCKHCYSVLNYLNYSSLREYLDSQQLITA
jgi:hypothetical protein